MVQASIGDVNMENHTDIKPIGQVWDKTELDDINAWSKLTVLANESYSVGAAAKSAAGIGTPNLHLELTHALAWFFVSDRPPLFGVLFAYPAIGILSVMVARAGQPSGWPVSSGCAGSSNPVRATTMRLEPLVGSDNLSHPEAAIMATVPTPITPVVRVFNGQAVTTSLDLAEYFGKNHRDVLRKIETLDCSLDFIERNFALISYTDGLGRKKPCYQLTRDGFFFVAMGFTGRRAAEFKEAYIAAFNAMEQRLAQPALLAKLDANYQRDALFAAMQHLAVIRQAWDGQLYDGLKALGSPLAVSLHDRVHLACWSLQTAAKYSGCDETMATALAATQPPAFPRAQHCAVATTQQGGRKHG
ncbi:Rha family phage regulatory protein [Aeromonas allosaccharophila]|uniref:Rha family phage regulatory protein n=1 Tax=Aeromonas allosaccharophila TaxID=656 RepID=UPI0034239ED4